MAKQDRPLEELKLRVLKMLDSQVSKELREQCIEIARKKSPSSAFDLAREVARQTGFGLMECESVAKATRWLSVIRRDHGDVEFDLLVKTLTESTTSTVK